MCRRKYLEIGCGNTDVSGKLRIAFQLKAGHIYEVYTINSSFNDKHY